MIKPTFARLFLNANASLELPRGTLKEESNVEAYRHGNWRKYLSSLALLSMCMYAVAEGELPEQSPTPMPAENYSINPGGVDMRTGQFVYHREDLSIGGEYGLSLVRQNGIEFGIVGKPFGNLSHNWEVFMILREQDAEYTADYTVSIDGRSSGFRGGITNMRPSQSSPGGKEVLEGNGTGSSRYWVYTAKDGTEVTFRPEGNELCNKKTAVFEGGSGSKCMYASELVKPDGLTYTFSYDNPTSSSGDARLRSVTSNYGYALLLEYEGSSEKIDKACLLNLATHIFPNNNVCPSGALTSTYNYSGNGFLSSATNALGHTYTYQSTYTDYSESYEVRHYLPGQSQPYLTNEYGAMVLGTANHAVDRQVFSDGRVYEYTWIVHDHGDDLTFERAGGRYSLNSGPEVSVFFQLLDRPGPFRETGKTVSPGPSTIVDELGRTHTANYCIPNDGAQGGGCIIVPARYWNYSDGRSLQLKYDPAHRNIIERRWTSRSGAEPDLVTGSTFGSCLTPLLCSKPIQTVDGRGNATDFTYNTVHGLLTSTLEPADNDGIRPLTWRQYAQKRAWIKLASGGYQQVAEPVWVLASEHRCITTQGSFNTSTGVGSCAGGAADEVVTRYEYGNSNEANNLNVTGVIVSSGGESLRTCYEYDDYGRQIGETSPRAGLGACP
uniref:hypothetical protein n=1 Tax=Microbulbifer agarilyticus TaxID=260552 RepID=UPI000255B855|nr:hypothetical protein [Microbulbifer agarilyticus]